jgi:aromatic-L-amino-acid decarboxylase
VSGRPPDDLRAGLERVASWAEAYLRGAGDLPVLSTVEPGAVLAELPPHPPTCGESMDAILDDVDRVLLPGITHWNHPGFMAYFANTGSPPGIVGEAVTAALNVNAMLWRTSPAATELEQRVLQWAAELFGLPAGWFGQITDGASSSTHHALAAAREAAGLDIRRRGMAGRTDLPRLRVYCSQEAHSSVDKACIALGLGQEGLRRVDVDAGMRMRTDALAAAIAADLAEGVRPIAVVATVGTTSSTAIDPVADIADVCREHGLWLHVDAAYGGSAAVCPELRGVLAGCDRADSIVINPHKWLLTPMDCSLLWCARPDALRAAFALTAEYLRSEDGEVTNLMDYGLALGRRFRALKLWMVIRWYGAEGLARTIRGHVAEARRLAAAVEAEPGWELLAPVPFSTVCFRHRPDGMDEEALSAHNAAVLAAVNRSGEVFLSHTVLAGRYAIRAAIGNAATDRDRVDRAWARLREAAGLQLARAPAPASA